MPFRVEVEREEDGRWIADVPTLPGCLAYGATRDEAVARVVLLSLHVVAERIENGEMSADSVRAVFEVAA
jgi:predicted RNase H-like HicB family nuclease